MHKDLSEITGINLLLTSFSKNYTLPNRDYGSGIRGCGD